MALVLGIGQDYTPEDKTFGDISVGRCPTLMAFALSGQTSAPKGHKHLAQGIAL